MAKQSIYGIINGCLNWVVVRLCLLELVQMWFGYVTCFFPNSRTWDPGKLASYFLPWEVKKVGGSYVGEAEAEDVLIWPLSPFGS